MGCETCTDIWVILLYVTQPLKSCVGEKNRKYQVKSVSLTATQVFSSATFTKSKTFWRWKEQAQGKPLICHTLTYKHTHTQPYKQIPLHKVRPRTVWIDHSVFFFFFESAFPDKQTPFNGHLRSRTASSEALPGSMRQTRLLCLQSSLLRLREHA